MAIFQLMAYMSMLYSIIELPATCAGLGIIVVVAPVNTRIMKILFHEFDVLNSWHDKRVKFVNEILQGILGVKMGAWEEKLAHG
jgi:hypothetical protein